MNRVHQQLAPEKIANTPEFAVCVSYLLIPVFTFELRNPFSRLKDALREMPARVRLGFSGVLYALV